MPDFRGIYRKAHRYFGRKKPFIGSKAGAPSMTVSPLNIPANHAGHITLILTGSNTVWNNATTVFTISGVSGVTKISQNVSSATSATLVITTGAGTGTLTIQETVTGSTSATTTVATATLSLSPNSGNAGSSETVTATGTNTVWTQEVASGLFSESGSASASISSIVVISDTSATFLLTNGSVAATLTITDNSAGETATFTVNAVPVVYNLMDPTVGQKYFQVEGGATQATDGISVVWNLGFNDGAVRFKATCQTIEVHVLQNGTICHLYVDGTDNGSPVTLPNTSTHGWVTITSSADPNTQHLYMVAFGGPMYIDQVRLTSGTNANTAYLPARQPVGFFGDSITAGTAGTGGDSCLAFPRLVCNSLNYQCLNRGRGSTYVSSSQGGSNAGENQTPIVTESVPPPFVIVNLYGTNDAGAGVSQGTFGASYLNMLQFQQWQAPSCIIVNERLLKTSLGDTSRDPYSTTISTEVTAMNTTKIVYKQGAYGAYDGSNGVHPNAAQNGPIATAVAADITASLPTGGGGGGSVLRSGIISGMAI